MDDQEEKLKYLSKESENGNKKRSMTIVKARSRGKKGKNKYFLHEELIFHTLAYLPAQCLHNTMSRVCSGWADIIRDPLFKKVHLSQQKPVLLFHSRGFQCNFGRHLQLLDAEELNIIDTYRLFPGIVFPGNLLNSCDGLMLFCDGKRLCILNPVTMQLTAIPCLTSTSSPRKHYSFVRSPLSLEYKLVYLDTDESQTCRWFVLNLGTSSWRRTHVRHSCTCEGPAIFVGGFLFWAPVENGFQVDHHIIAMDVINESLHTIHSPVSEGEVIGCHEMGNWLSMVVKDVKHKRIDVFVLRDFPTGEWINFHKIDCGLFTHGFPVKSFGWVNIDQMLIFLVGASGITYNAYSMESKKAKAIDGLPLPATACVHNFSLVWWES